MSRGHGWLERTILRELPKTTALSAASLFANAAPDSKFRMAFRSSVNRALRNLEAAGKIERADFIVTGVKVRAWRRADAPERRKATAYHEAGHAVIGYALRCAVESVTIKPSGRDTLGHVEIDSSAKTNRTNEILAIMAGPLAESKFTRSGMSWDDIRHGSDFRAVQYARKILSEKPLTNERYEARTRKLVDKHWSQITRVAAALLRRETLSRTQLRDLCNE